MTLADESIAVAAYWIIPVTSGLKLTVQSVFDALGLATPPWKQWLGRLLVCTRICTTPALVVEHVTHSFLDHLHLLSEV